MLPSKTILILTGVASLANAITFAAYKDTDCLVEDAGNIIKNAKIDPRNECRAVPKKRPATAFKIDVSGAWSACTGTQCA